MQSVARFSAHLIRYCGDPLSWMLCVGIFGRVVLAADLSPGAVIYQAKCASCHGATGEGKPDSYPHPLVGDRSIGELTEYVRKAMPEDKPGTCTPEEARLVSQFIHEILYFAH